MYGTDFDEDLKLKALCSCPHTLADVTMMIHVLGAKLNGSGFLRLNESKLDHLGVSIGFQLIVMDIIMDLVCAAGCC